MATLLKPEQINSKFFKKQLMSHLFYELHFPIVVDEHNFMDVFGIRKNGYMVEYEIKISKSDLIREIKLMKCEQPTQYSKDWVKWEKHANYLKRKIDETKLNSYYRKMKELMDQSMSTQTEQTYFLPNEFYFYVPDFLAETALKETINTPYGVISIGGKLLPMSGRIIFDNYIIHKRAQKIHTDIANENLYKEVAHELTIRNRLFHEKST